MTLMFLLSVKSVLSECNILIQSECRSVCHTGDHQSSLLFNALDITLSIEQVKAQLLPLFIPVYVCSVITLPIDHVKRALL